MRALPVFALILLAAGAPAAPAQVPGFEAVSIKPSAADSKGSQTSYDPGRIIARGVNLKQLVEWAYQVSPVQVSGGPGWMDSKFFDVEAQAEGEHTKDELLAMLQPVLAQRFKLALHRETKEMSVSLLTTAGPNRSKLQAAQGGPANIALGLAPGGADKADKFVTLVITGHSVSMQFFANYLTGIFGRLVVDRTGLTSSFDFRTEVALEANEITTDKRAAVISVLSDALPQLGLKLETRKEPVENLIIDHAEEPSAN